MSTLGDVIVRLSDRLAAAQASLPESEKIRQLEEQGLAVEAEREKAQSDKLKAIIDACTGLVNSEANGRIPKIGINGTNFRSVGKTSVPNGFSIMFLGQDVKQSLGALSIILNDEVVRASTAGPGPHDPETIKNVELGSVPLADLTGDWLEQMLVAWMSQEPK